ncbi:MAG TPA: dTDP-glucose 4,6-dehydratase [Methylophilaceae bacterium]|nr:dTDP-glucose 4,6-dehydratase [Methylophilaceae bacterium]
MKLLVTGGAGFIGSAFIREAISRGLHVLNVDALTYASSLENLSSIESHPAYSFKKIDITDRASIDAAINDYEPDAIVHLAAESHVDRSIEGPLSFIQTNIIGTYNLLESSRAYWQKNNYLSQFKFLHVSTDEVFGSLGDQGLFNEDSAYLPNSPYSASKASSDHLVRAWGETYGLPVLITNCSNNYGPFQFPEKLIPVTIMSAIAGNEIPIYGSGNNIRDWLYVNDHVDALLLVLSKGQTGRTYNIGGNTELTNLELVQKICSLLDMQKPAHKPYVTQIAFVEDRPGHDQRYAIDASRIKKELGWKPMTSIESGLEKTISWYLENQSWMKKLLERDGVRPRFGPHS